MGEIVSRSNLTVASQQSQTMSIVASIVILFLGLVIGMQLLVRFRAKAMQGRPVPAIPGPIGKQVKATSSALLYFMSPNCGACRAWTPKLKALSQKNRSVFVIDVSSQFEVARALNVMATPSAVEIRDGRVQGYHVGAIPAQVLERYA
jgi:thiol-disulfide isomerase/thioredoxin